jgi:hypothetical protein
VTAPFTASVYPEGNWFVIDVHDVGFTQCRELDQAEAKAVGFIAAMLDLDPSAVRVEIVEVAA